MRKLMITLTGPSCSGKTTLQDSLVERYPNLFVRLKSDTTRPRRPGEDDTEYDFITRDQFRDRMLQGDYLQTVDYSGVLYGTRKSEMKSKLESGKALIRIVEPTGVDQFKVACIELEANLVSVFVMEEMETVLYRWLKRLASDKNPDIDFYHRRIITTLDEESNWVNERKYDFYYDLKTCSEAESQWMLSRLATGAISIGAIRNMTPSPLPASQ